MKPPLFTYDEINHIRDIFLCEYDETEDCERCASILAKCRKTLEADPRFREPHK